MRGRRRSCLHIQLLIEMGDVNPATRPRWGAVALLACVCAIGAPLSEAQPATPACPIEGQEFDFLSIRSAVSDSRRLATADYTGSRDRVTDAMSDIHADWRNRLWNAGGFDCLDEPTRHAAYLALRSLALHTDNASVMDDLALAWVSLDTDTAVSEAKTHHRVMVTQRKFADAAALRERFPNIPPPMAIANADCADCPPDITRTMLKPAGDGLVRISVDVSDYTGLVVVGHPGCGFTRQMWEDLAEDPELTRAVREDALWIADPWVDITPASVQHFQSLSPDMPFNVAWKLSDWPEFDTWSLPTIYAFRDGKVAGRHSGWPRGEAEKTRAKLRALLSDNTEL